MTPHKVHVRGCAIRIAVILRRCQKQVHKEFDDYVKIWGEVEYDAQSKPINKSKPILVEPNKTKDNEKYEKEAF
ncbi:TPA: hypothetical protein ACFOAD_002098 [Neisseria meningitidis]